MGFLLKTAVAFILLCADNVFADESDHVISYDEDEFKEKVPAHPHFILFYAPWCGHCKRFFPLWEEFGQKYNKDDSVLYIGKVDCSLHTRLCSSQEVTGYPTLKIFARKSLEGLKYKGSREKDVLENFIAKQLGLEYKSDEPDSPTDTFPLVEFDFTFEELIKDGRYFIKFYAPWCGHCQKLAPTWKALAEAFGTDSSITIGKLDCTKYQTICTKFKVTGYPTLLWIVDGSVLEKYSGNRSLEDLKNFVERQLRLKNVAEQPKDNTFSSPDSAVIVAEPDTFKSHIQTGVTFVKFFAPWCGHCKRMAPAYEELGKKFEGHSHVKIAKVDCTSEANRELCNEEQVNGFPTLHLYRDGKRVEEYNGDRSLEDMVSFITSHLSHDEL